MPTYADQLAQQAGQEAFSGIMGIALGKYNDKRQVDQQRRLQELQIQGNKQMTDYSYEKQLQMWKDTSYAAQIEQMKKAGVNPALLYGMSGGGGITTGGGAETVTGSNANQNPGEVQQLYSITAQTALQDAQRKLLEAQTNKTNIEAAKTAGVDTEQTKAATENTRTSTASLAQGIENQKAAKAYTEAQTQMQYIQNEIQGAEQNDLKAIIRYNMRKLYAEMQSAEIQQNVDKNLQDIKVKQAQATVALTVMDKWLKEAQAKGIAQDIIESVQRTSYTVQENMRQWDKMAQTNTQLRQQQERIDYDTSVPAEIKELLDMIFIIPTGGAKKVNPVGFKLKP